MSGAGHNQEVAVTSMWKVSQKPEEKWKWQITRNNSTTTTTTTKTAAQDRAMCLYLPLGWVTSEYFPGRRHYKAQENRIPSFFYSPRQRSEYTFIRKESPVGKGQTGLLCFSTAALLIKLRWRERSTQKINKKIKNINIRGCGGHFLLKSFRLTFPSAFEKCKHQM